MGFWQWVKYVVVYQEAVGEVCCFGGTFRQLLHAAWPLISSIQSELYTRGKTASRIKQNQLLLVP